MWLALVCHVDPFLWVVLSSVWELCVHSLPCCSCPSHLPQPPPTHLISLTPAFLAALLMAAPSALWPVCAVSLSPHGVPVSVSLRTGALLVYPQCTGQCHRCTVPHRCLCATHECQHGLSCFSATLLALICAHRAAPLPLCRTQTLLASALRSRHLISCFILTIKVFLGNLRGLGHTDNSWF